MLSDLANDRFQCHVGSLFLRTRNAPGGVFNLSELVLVLVLVLATPLGDGMKRAPFTQMLRRSYRPAEHRVELLPRGPPRIVFDDWKGAPGRKLTSQRYLPHVARANPRPEALQRPRSDARPLLVPSRR